MKCINNVWSTPETAFFSGTFSDVDITISPDGKKLFFASDRPDPEKENMDIYYLEKTSNGWSQPKFVEGDVNSIDGDEIHASLSLKNNLFSIN